MQAERVRVAADGRGRAGKDVTRIVTLEGIVEGGQIRLPTNVRLPESTRVYIVVPGFEVQQVARLFSPRLARPEQASDFELEVVEEAPDAGV